MDHASSSKRKIENPHEGTKLVKRSKNNETFLYKLNSISENDEDHLILGDSPPFLEVADEAAREVSPPPCGGERVKKYWAEVSSRKVFIPERWNQEGLLMDWTDYSSFDSLLAPKGIDLARKALIAQAQTSHQQEKRL